MNFIKTLEDAAGKDPPQDVKRMYCRGALAAVMALASCSNDEERALVSQALAMQVAIARCDPKQLPATDPDVAHLTIAWYWNEELEHTDTRGRVIEALREIFYLGAEYVVINIATEASPFNRPAYETVKLEVARANGYAEAPVDWFPGLTADDLPKKVN